MPVKDILFILLFIGAMLLINRILILEYRVNKYMALIASFLFTIALAFLFHLFDLPRTLSGQYFWFYILFITLGIITLQIKKPIISHEEETYLRKTGVMDKTLCPYCKQPIVAMDTACRYCGRSLITSEPNLPPDHTEPAGMTNPADIILDMDDPGLAADPELVPVDEADRRAALWVAGTLFVMSTLAGLIYLATR